MMTLSENAASWIFFLVGIGIVVAGFFSKSHINEVDFPATKEERAQGKATPASRIFFVVIGLASSIYGIVRWLR
jgi:hypothetical protein